MRERLAAMVAALGLAMGLVGGLVLLTPAPAQATWVIDGCDESQPNIQLDVRQDKFEKATVSIVTAVGQQASYKFWDYTRYFYCNHTIDNSKDKVKVKSFKFCVEKLDNHNPPSAGVASVQHFSTSAIYDELTNAFGNPDPVDIGGTYLYWDGIGTDGSQRCTDWREVFGVSGNRWMWMVNDPYTTAQAHIALAVANDPEPESYHDVNYGGTVHWIKPATDPVIST